MIDSNEKQILRQADRRTALKVGGLALLGAASLAVIHAEAAERPNSPDDPPCGNQPPDPNSVFVKSCKKESADKYTQGDNDNTYRIAALWLLLTTEDWSTYVDTANGHTTKEWLAGVANELQLPSKVVSDLWTIVTNKSSARHFKAVRATFQNFTASTELYGHRPCPGGKSAASIACLAKTAPKATTPLQ